MKCLSIGSGSLPLKRKVLLPQTQNLPIEWTTLDIDPYCQPDFLFDLNDMEQGTAMLPFGNEVFDEIHAYSVMGLYGRQGDAEGFFRGMGEYWRVLKPGGLFVGGTPAPNDAWAWGEPSAKRIVNHKTFLYLTRAFYDKLGSEPLSDYRAQVAPRWWTIEFSEYGTAGDCQTYHWVLRKER